MTTTSNEEPPLKRKARRLIELRGLEPAARELGIGRQSLACYLARIPLQRGTLELIERKLNELGDEPRPARCPTCTSNDPRMHPVVEGDVDPCADPWHELGRSGGGDALPR